VDFIHELVARDLASGKYGGRVAVLLALTSLL
jgi:hypothetical protein